MHQMTNRELFTTFLPEEKTEALFNHFRSLRNMIRAPYEEFVEIGLDKHDVKQVRAVLELSRKYAARTPEIKKINSAKLFSPLIDLEKILSSAIIQIRGKPHDKKRLYTRIQRTDIKGMPRGRECCCCRQAA